MMAKQLAQVLKGSTWAVKDEYTYFIPDTLPCRTARFLETHVSGLIVLRFGEECPIDDCFTMETLLSMFTRMS